MGIINVNDDSFSGDGTLDFADAIVQARGQISAGADIIDVGAESARTNRAAISVDEEVRRFSEFIKRWGECWKSEKPIDEEQIWPPVLSANTWRAEVVERILRLGDIEIINDMGALPDGRNAEACAAHQAALLIMHSIGEPKISHLSQQWPDVMGELERFFHEKIALAIGSGLPGDALILDPGIDFAKQRKDNLKIYRELARLQKFDLPVLVPVSRKTVIGEVLDLPVPTDRDAGTLACISASMHRGAQIFRIHDVTAAWQTVKLLNRVM